MPLEKETARASFSSGIHIAGSGAFVSRPNPCKMLYYDPIYRKKEGWNKARRGLVTPAAQFCVD